MLVRRNVATRGAGCRKRMSMHVLSELDGMWSDSVTWGEVLWGLGHTELQELKGVIRATHLSGRKKFDWMSRFPYLLCNLGKPGVKERCMQQWHAVPPQDHHRVSVGFLAESSRLRQDVGLLHDGGPMPEELQSAVRALAAGPLDDVVNEGPHAQARRLTRHARRACWPWIGASVRVKQNLADIQDLAPAVGADKVLWASVASIVRVGGGHPLQCVRMPKQRLVDYVYRLALCFEAAAEDPDFGGDVAAAGNASGEDAAGSEASVEPQHRERSAADNAPFDV